MVKAVRLFTGSDGESHFEEIQISVKDSGVIGSLSNPIKAENFLFHEKIGKGSVDWHNAPRRQYVIILIGNVEVEVGGGVKRVFSPGEVILAEDLTGRGHITTCLTDHVSSVLIPVVEK